MEECSIDELSQREVYWIGYYDSYKNGYNVNGGGSGNANPLGLDYEAMYQSFLETNSLQKTANIFNCSVTPVRNAIRQHGIDLSECSKEKMVEQIDPNTLEVIATYPSLAEASRAVGVTYSAISRIANGHGSNAAGYYWRFAESDKALPKATKRWKRKIGQYDRETGELIASFDSAADAARSLGKDAKNGGSCIIAACKDAKKTSYGYKWQYLD